MASSDRPSGLTALAVINFMFGILQLLGAIGLIASKLFVQSYLANEGASVSPQERAEMQLVADTSWLDVGLVAGLSFAIALCLIVSGIGYLKQKRILGRWVGNAYAFGALASVVVSLTILPEVLSQGFSIAVIRSLIYPLFTLGLLNRTFRRDLAR